MWRSLSTVLRGRSSVHAGARIDELPTVAPAAAWPSEVTPDVIGLPVTEARRLGRMDGQRVFVIERTTGHDQWGRVLEQEPAAGLAFDPDGMLVLTVGARPDVTVPDVRGRAEDDARSMLRQAGLGPARRATRGSDRVPEGHVVRTRPRAGAEVPVGSTVSYVLAAEQRPARPAGHHEQRRVRTARQPDGSFRRDSEA